MFRRVRTTVTYKGRAFRDLALARLKSNKFIIDGKTKSLITRNSETINNLATSDVALVRGRNGRTWYDREYGDRKMNRARRCAEDFWCMIAGVQSWDFCSMVRSYFLYIITLRLIYNHTSTLYNRNLRYECFSCAWWNYIKQSVLNRYFSRATARHSNHYLGPTQMRNWMYIERLKLSRE